MFPWISREDYARLGSADVEPLLEFYYNKTGKIYPYFNYETYPDGVDQYLQGLYALLEGEDLEKIRREFWEKHSCE